MMRARDLAVLLLALAALPLRAEDARSTVGLPGTLKGLVLPGGELEVKPPSDRRSPVLVRITAVWPQGTAHRYDIEYVGLEAGAFDLRGQLRRKDGSSTADLPPIRVTIDSVLPKGQVRPAELEPGFLPRLGGYRTLVIAGAVLWVIGLLAILLVGRKRSRPAAAGGPPPASLAERLQPLVESAIAGQRDPTRLAELERHLIAYWERRLKLDDRPPAEALPVMRRHPDAGPLLVQLEAWLHRPAAREPADVNALLEPYRHLPPDALPKGAFA